MKKCTIIYAVFFRDMKKNALTGKNESVIMCAEAIKENGEDNVCLISEIRSSLLPAAQEG